MKNLFLFLLIIFSSCSLNIPIEDQIIGLESIDNPDTANELLSTAYLNLPKNEMELAVLSDGFEPNKNLYSDLDKYNLYRWHTQNIYFLALNLWQNYYSVINTCNILIEQIPNIQNINQEEEKELQHILAQTYTIKSLAYFKLVQLFAPTHNTDQQNILGIILKDNVKVQSLPRSSVTDCYTEIVRLLNNAIDLFEKSGKNNTNKFRFSTHSAKALKAKALLNSQNYDECIQVCREVKSEYSLSKQNFTSAWENPNRNDEVLLAFENNSFYYSEIYDNSIQKYQFFTNRNLRYDPNDYRKDQFFITEEYTGVTPSIQANYISTYIDNLNDNTPKNIIAIRTAELYFIEAEALYKKNSFKEAHKVLNQLQTIRHSVLTPYLKDNLLNDILLEKQKEFIGEGLRYFDMKRNGLQLNRLNYKTLKLIDIITADDYRWVFPIPQNEIRQNNQVKQNPVWETTI